MSSEWNRRLKGWPGWVVLLFAVVALLTVGIGRDSGPRSADERLQSITERVACPVCDGESVAASRSATAENIRERVDQLVDEGVMSNDEIIDEITAQRGYRELLVPRASGLEALAWALPATAFVVAVVSLYFVFARWRRQASGLARATDDDYRLVAAALTSESNVDADPDNSDSDNSDSDSANPVRHE